MKSRLRLLVLCAVSLLCLWLAVQGVDMPELVPAVIGADGRFLALTVAFTVGTLFVRACRWRVLLPPTGKANMADLFIATSVGLAAINLIPARLGEVVRAYALRARAGISVSTALATLVVERVLDLAAVLAALGVVLVQLPLPEWVQRSGQALLLADAVILVVLVLLHRYPATARLVARRSLAPLSTKWASRIEGLLTSFTDGLSILSRPGHLLAALGWTLVLWAVVGLAILSNLQALRLPATPLSTLTVLAVLSLGLTVPSGPGFVGTFEFFAVFSLGLLGISRTPAMAFALVFHAIQFLPTVVIGVVCLWAGGLGGMIAWPLRSPVASVPSVPEMESAGE